jgi:WD40 repeat protein
MTRPKLLISFLLVALCRAAVAADKPTTHHALPALPAPREVGQLVGETGGMLVFSLDGSKILTANGSENTSNSMTCAQLWDAKTFEPLNGVLEHAGLRRAQFDAAGDKVLTVGCVDDGAPKWNVISGQAKLWDARTGKLLLGPILHGTRPVSDAAISPDGSVIVTCLRGDNAVCLWDATTGRLKATLPQPQDVESVQFDQTGHTLVASSDKGVMLWDVPSCKHPVTLADLHGGLSSHPPSISANGKRIVVADMYEFTVYDLGTGHKISTIRPPLHLDEGIGGVSISPNGRLVATSSMAEDANQGAVWDVASGQALFTVKDAFTGVPRFSPDSSKVLFSVYHGAALWDIRSRRPITLPGDLDRDDAAFSPDGKRLAIYSFHGFTSILALKEPS